MHRGLMGAALGGGGGGWGAKARGGVEPVVGVGCQQRGGVSTSKNRPSHHKYKYKSPR